MTLFPRLVLWQSFVKEYLQQGEQFVIFCGDDCVETEQGVKVKECGQAESSHNGIYGGVMRRGCGKGTDVCEGVLEGRCARI